MPLYSNFPNLLLKWFDHHGRHDLPWQKNRDPYLIWISEIMLQQTQVKTVIPYFERFINRFKTIDSLAQAELDEVLSYWTGLGYYHRARHLHRAAQMMIEIHQGQFPQDIDAVIALPGIGPSTAGAILSFAFEQRQIILDGNVRRVLSRLLMLKEEPALWTWAEKLTPKKRVSDYNQAMMDLGATLCTRSKPDCSHCPVQKKCLAYLNDVVTDYPAPKKSKIKPVEHLYWLMLFDPAQGFLLTQRPATGIWAQLWTFPQFDDKQHVQTYLKQNQWHKAQWQDPLQHELTHRSLFIHPILVHVKQKNNAFLAINPLTNQKQIWYNLDNPPKIGLAKPVQQLLHNGSSSTP